MPKLTLLLGRKTMNVYDLPGPVLIGREGEVDILIDNPSVSRKQAEIRADGDGWVVEDLGSSNGTFVNGERIDGAHPVTAGDEIGIGKFSLVFDKVVGDAPAPTRKASGTTAGGPGQEGTLHIKAHEVEELLKDSSQQRRAHLDWESGGQRGTHHLSDAPAALFGTDELCDVRVPSGPKHHLLVIRTPRGCEARNLAMFGKMKVNGSATRRARLRDGDTLEMGGLKITFADDVG